MNNEVVVTNKLFFGDDILSSRNSPIVIYLISSSDGSLSRWRCVKDTFSRYLNTRYIDENAFSGMISCNSRMFHTFSRKVVYLDFVVRSFSNVLYGDSSEKNTLSKYLVHDCSLKPYCLCFNHDILFLEEVNHIP